MITNRSFNDEVGVPGGKAAKVLILNNRGQCVHSGVAHCRTQLRHILLSELERRRELAFGSLVMTEKELREVAEIVSWKPSASPLKFGCEIEVRLK